MIKGPTRTTQHLHSYLIDHILTNTCEYIISKSSIIDTVVSDHSMVYCALEKSQEQNAINKEITFHSLKNYSVDVYKEALEKVSIPIS